MFSWRGKSLTQEECKATRVQSTGNVEPGTTAGAWARPAGNLARAAGQQARNLARKLQDGEIWPRFLLSDLEVAPSHSSSALRMETNTYTSKLSASVLRP